MPKITSKAMKKTSIYCILKKYDPFCINGSIANVMYFFKFFFSKIHSILDVPYC